jgi:hypothetical protein
MSLSKEQIEFMEKQISEQCSSPSCKNKGIPAISPKNNARMDDTLEEIKNAEPTTYISFGGSGFYTYSFYKSKSGKIYFVEVYMDDENSIRFSEL